MFDFLISEDGKARREATHWLEMAERVYDNRRDLLPAAQLAELQAARGDLKAAVKAKAGAAPLKAGMERLEKCLRSCGGKIYPVNSMVENVEFFLVAAIVILGLRAYFVQPFKIPTNSMWPSYYGMTYEAFEPGHEPNVLVRGLRLLTLGAIRQTVVAPADGEVMLAVSSNGAPLVSQRAGRSFLIFPSMRQEFTFMVGGQVVTLDLPAEFDAELNWMRDTVFGQPSGGIGAAIGNAIHKTNGRLESSMLSVQDGNQRGDVRAYWLPVGRKVKRGDTIASFDILTGDLLFVERVSYNFVAPKVGSGFVFRTENIHSEEMQDRAGNQIKQYFVKRLVGTPGDELEVRPPMLYRNGQPIEGSPAFGWNAERKGLYPGYTNVGMLPAGEKLTVPEHSYFAMGDNSPRSKDSRMWGFVPEKDVVGRPLFIYYPLTKRWGLAH